MGSEAINWKALGVDDAVEDLNGLDYFDPLIGDLDTKMLINAASELAKGGVDSYNKSQAEDKAKSDEAKRTADGIAADIALATSLTNLYAAQGLHKDAATVAALQTIVDARRPMVFAVPQTTARAKVCADAVQQAADALSKSPNDAQLAAALRAWREVCGSAGPVPSAGLPAAQIPGGQPPAPKPDGGPSFLTRKYWGVPAWELAVGVPTIVGGIVLLVRAFTRKKGGR